MNPVAILLSFALASAVHAEAPVPVPVPIPAAVVETHAESAEFAKPVAPGGASSPSEPAPSLRGLPTKAGGGSICANGSICGNGGNGEQSPTRHSSLVTRHSQATVTLSDGSVLKGSLPADATIKLDTLLGPVRIPLSQVSSLAIATEETHSSLVTRHSSLLYHCTFDSAAAIEKPLAGPSGTFLGGSFVPGKKGNALRVEKDAAAFEAALPKGFLGPEGCIEFWAKIESDDPRYVDGGDPLFFSLFDERGAVTLLQFAANNGFARGGLGGAIASWPFGTVAHWSGVMPYEDVLGPDWAGWHHYAMSWKAKGFGDGSFVKVFVDGKPQPVLGGVDDDKVPARLADLPNHDFLLGFPWGRTRVDNRNNRRPFLIDEFRIWNEAKTDFDAN
ncbi:MAG: hypothetical protein II839_01335 [Kiritimatiellae bacterium]|nr:hypothetical protein [Kiritimatiellia bacterium]